FSMLRLSPISPLFPYTTLFRSGCFLEFAEDVLITSNDIACILGAFFLHADERTFHVQPGQMGAAFIFVCRSGRKHFLQFFYRKRSEEHTSELQSRFDLVCRLLL